ncbi:MAG: hypothetical protein IV092_07645 [Burkholderiaceae bacterium]|nr:hypothetical protein [Burkholderiaceae bacterium]
MNIATLLDFTHDDHHSRFVNAPAVLVDAVIRKDLRLDAAHGGKTP